MNGSSLDLWGFLRVLLDLVTVLWVLLNGICALIGPRFWIRFVGGYYGRAFEKCLPTEENLRSPSYWIGQRVLGLFLTPIGFFFAEYLLGFNILAHPILLASLTLWIIIACVRTYPRRPPDSQRTVG